MRITENKYSKKTKIIFAAVTAVILTGGVAGALLLPISPFAINKDEIKPENTVDYKESSDDQKQAGYDAKEDFINKHENSSSSPGVDDGSSLSDIVTMTISSANQVEQTYQIRTIIEVLDNEGLCVLTLEKSGQEPITQEVGTQILGSYSVCKGFDVPISEKGEWQLGITYKGSAGQGSVKQSIGVK